MLLSPQPNTLHVHVHRHAYGHTHGHAYTHFNVMFLYIQTQTQQNTIPLLRMRAHGVIIRQGNVHGHTCTYFYMYMYNVMFLYIHRLFSNVSWRYSKLCICPYWYMVACPHGNTIASTGMAMHACIITWNTIVKAPCNILIFHGFLKLKLRISCI